MLHTYFIIKFQIHSNLSSPSSTKTFEARAWPGIQAWLTLISNVTVHFVTYKFPEFLKNFVMLQFPEFLKNSFLNKKYI